MFSTATTAWLTGIVFLAGLLILSIGQVDRLTVSAPLAQAQAERLRSIDLERLCAGIVSREGLEECRLTAMPMSARNMDGSRTRPLRELLRVERLPRAIGSAPEYSRRL